MHGACQLFGKPRCVLLNWVLMQHPQTSASTDSRAEGPLSLPDYGAGGGFAVDSTVAGPYLTGIVTSGSYIAPLPSAVAVATAGGPTQTAQASQASPEALKARESEASQATAMNQAPARPHLPAVVRPDHLRRGNDRCVLLLAAHQRPDPALLASLERRNVETLICFDPHDVVARLCLMAREVQTAERKGLLPLPGGIALIVCEPAKVPQLASVVHTVRRYAARCVCWQFAPATAGSSASLRPLSDEEILRTGDAAAEIAAGPDTSQVPRTGVSLGGQAGGSGSARAEVPGLRLANWAISQADNPPGEQLDTLKETFSHKKPPLSSPELAMLLAEFPVIPSVAATSQRSKETGAIGSGREKLHNGELPL